MGLEVFRRLVSIGKRATDVGTEVSATMGIKAGLGYPIAIDFGVGSLKILQINPGDPPTLAAAACLDTPEELIKKPSERLQFQAQNLPRLIREGGFKGKRAVCAIPAWKTMCKNLQFAKQEGLSTAALVGGAIQTQLNLDPFTMVHRHIEVQTGAMGKTEVIVVAAERDLVDKLMGAIHGAKLQPVGMQSEFDAMLVAFGHINRRDEDKDKSTLLLDLGSTTTKVAICHGKSMVFARVIEFGGRNLDATIADQLGCSLAEARRRRMALDDKMANATADMVPKVVVGSSTPLEPREDNRPERRERRLPRGVSGDVVADEAIAVAPKEADLGDALEMLTDEILMCLRYHGSQFAGRKLDRAVFVGGESRHRGLCQHIARKIRMPAHMADPMAWVARTGDEPTIGVDLKKPQPGWAVALGLCLSPTDL
jgi:type IV pilus assembly protein PilM